MGSRLERRRRIVRATWLALGVLGLCALAALYWLRLRPQPEPARERWFTGVEYERIVLQHVQEQHDFTLTMSFRELAAGQTFVIWRLRFASEDEARRIRPFVEQGNEQNFDRLAAHLASRQA